VFFENLKNAENIDEITPFYVEMHFFNFFFTIFMLEKFVENLFLHNLDHEYTTKKKAYEIRLLSSI
jgi:hypothetical protein